MKTTLVTGSSGSIGAAIATRLASPGQKLYLHYNRGKPRALQVKELCEEKGAEVQLITADLATNTGVKHLLTSIYGVLDQIILASGKSCYGILADHSEEMIHEIMQLHLLSPVHIVKHFLPNMISKKQGRIVAISSIWGEVGGAGEVIYSTAKGGLNTFVKALAKEVGPSNVTVNGIAPGVIATDMLEPFSEEEKQALIDAIPANRFGSAVEVAAACMYLLSDESAYVNGHILAVDGGWRG